MMIPEKKMVEIIEDHARLCDVIGQIACALSDVRVQYPNYVPLFNDTVLSDHISSIIERLRDREC